MKLIANGDGGISFVSHFRLFCILIIISSLFIVVWEFQSDCFVAKREETKGIRRHDHKKTIF